MDASPSLAGVGLALMSGHIFGLDWIVGTSVALVVVGIALFRFGARWHDRSSR